MPTHDTDNRRFFVVTVGRTGSSLLAAIMADSGADFGVQPVDDWSARRHRAKAGLKALLGRARYFKGEVDYLIHWTARFGYPPTVIVRYRPFEEVLRGLGHLHPQPPIHHADRYDTILRNGLALVSIYGGCVIDYGDLVDPGQTAWAGALAEATGLGEDRLLAARTRRVVSPAISDGEATEPFPSCRETYATLRRQNRIFLPPSPATRRVMEENEGT